jgi:SAM-dependent methyltransferase
MARGGWVESLGEDLDRTPAGHLRQGRFPRRGRVLDLDCGFGHSSIILGAWGLEVFGVDGGTGLIASAEATATPSGRALRFQTVDRLHLPFPDDWFAAALSLAGYGYLPTRSSRIAALDEIYRVLRGGAPLAPSYYVAPEEEVESPNDEEWRMQEAAGEHPSEGTSPSASDGATASFVRWLPAQAFREELSLSSFLVQRFVVEKLDRGRGAPMAAALLRKPSERHNRLAGEQ